MKHLLSMLVLVSILGFAIHAKIDTTSLLINTAGLGDTEALRAYCERKCLDDGDCVEKCMNLDQEDKQYS